VVYLKNQIPYLNDLLLVCNTLRQSQKQAKIKYLMESKINYLLDINVSLVPNPAHSKVSIVWSDNIKEPFTVEMVTLNGQIINVWNVKASAENFDINLQQYAQGFYLIKIQRNDKVTFKKLIIN
jgi:hypothetical protein